MKTKTLLVLLPALMLGAILWPSRTVPAADYRTAEVMREKLSHAQEILRGITLEDYDMIQAQAQKLSKLSQSAGWHARQTPEYELYTNELRRHADALAKAARNKNLDAASLSYFQLTVSCVSCHKYLRGTKAAGLEGLRQPGGAN